MNTAEVHAFASDHELAAHQLVIAVKVHDELAEGATGQRHVVGHPRVHRMPRFHNARIVDVVPKLHIVSNVVFYRLERFGPVVDHLSGHIAKRCENFVYIKVAFVGPAREGQVLLVGKVEGSGQQNQVAQTFVATQGGVDGGENRSNAPAQ